MGKRGSISVFKSVFPTAKTTLKLYKKSNTYTFLLVSQLVSGRVMLVLIIHFESDF
jgi:hypothetical protein